jgi:hypothetical protein
VEQQNAMIKQQNKTTKELQTSLANVLKTVQHVSNIMLPFLYPH